MQYWLEELHELDLFTKPEFIEGDASVGNEEDMNYSSAQAMDVRQLVWFSVSGYILERSRLSEASSKPASNQQNIP